MIIPVVLFVAILAITVGEVRLEAGQWLGLTATLFMGSIPIALIGLIVGLAFREESAQPLRQSSSSYSRLLGGVFAQSVAPPGALRIIVQASPSYHLVVLARSAVGGEGNVAGSILALVIITVIVGAATVVLYRRST